MERGVDQKIGAAGAVLQSLRCTVVMKRELSQKVKRSIYRSALLPTLTCGHERWDRSQIQATELPFLCGVAGVSLTDRVRSSVILE